MALARGASQRRLSRLSCLVPSLFSRPSSKHSLSLEDLHTDVLLLIFQYLEWPRDLHALSLVSRALSRHATPELYRTIVILPHHTHKNISLLARLEREDSLCDAVHTLVFDGSVRPVHPRIPRPQEFDFARAQDLADTPSWARNGAKDGARSNTEERADPQRVRLRLHHVLPKLRNLQSVYVKKWNHALQGPLSASECYHYFSPYGYEQRAGPKAGKTKFMQKLRFSAPYHGPPAVMHGDRQPCPLDIVSLLLLRCSKIEKLSVIGIFPTLRFSNPTFAFQKLTTLVVGEQAAGVTVWNDVLRHCKQLKVLCLLNVHFRFEKLMAGCFFPHLESIEWYAYAFTTSVSSRKPAKAFAEFIQRHSSTLKCIALAPRLYHPLRGLPYDGGLPFFDPDNGYLPNLETLRLSNWSIFISDHDRWPHTESSQFRACAEQICRFVAERPKLVDLTITDMPKDLEVVLRESLADRKMRRLMVGAGLLMSRTAYVPTELYVAPSRGWAVPGEWVRQRQAEWQSARKRDYLLEVWQSYEVMFSGLSLEQSGYRPILVDERCPRSWLDYLRVHHSL